MCTRGTGLYEDRQVHAGLFHTWTEDWHFKREIRPEFHVIQLGLLKMDLKRVQDWVVLRHQPSFSSTLDAEAKPAAESGSTNLAWWRMRSGTLPASFGFSLIKSSGPDHHDGALTFWLSSSSWLAGQRHMPPTGGGVNCTSCNLHGQLDNPALRRESTPPLPEPTGVQQ